MEPTLEQALQKGVEAHRAGNVQQADRYYTAILKSNPKHPDANHNMGVLAVGIGKVQEALPFFKTALEANPKIEQYWLSYMDALIKLDRMADAKAVFDQAKNTGMKGNGLDQIRHRLDGIDMAHTNNQHPLANQIQALITMYGEGRLDQVFEETQKLTKQYPKDLTLWKLMGASAAQTERLDQAVIAFREAIKIKPDYAEAYNNLGNALQYKGDLKEAVEAYNTALSIEPNYAEAHYNLGVTQQEKGKLNVAIKAFHKALSIKPDYAEAYYNIGNAHKELDKPKQAVEAYNKALSINPDYAEAHRNLSTIRTYTNRDPQLKLANVLYQSKKLSDQARCNLSFALGKMYEDIGKFDEAFKYLSEGNALRKKLLNYSIDQDKNLFQKLKDVQPYFLENSLDLKNVSQELIPIFILGMPRSGTTLVEQIVSSHSEVIGAEELDYIKLFGFKLATEPANITTAAVSELRERYLLKLTKLSKGKQFVTDKMPHNFRFIPLICAAFPEAKIIHVERNAIATCWSNYKQYFISNGLGYCYDLKDVVEYYDLYKDLMKFWQSEYSARIYNLNYENLVNAQENQTRKLINHLGLNWQNACISPHKNKRSVRTASQQQVQKKVYKGSSNAWLKYEAFLNGAFDSLSY